MAMDDTDSNSATGDDNDDDNDSHGVGNELTTSNR